MYTKESYYSVKDQRQHHHRTSYDRRVVVVHRRTRSPRSMNNALGLRVFMVIVAETLCVCLVWKKLSSESGCERKTYTFLGAFL